MLRMCVFVFLLVVLTLYEIQQGQGKLLNVTENS